MEKEQISRRSFLSTAGITAAVMLLFGGVNEVNGDPLTYKVEARPEHWAKPRVTIVSCDEKASGALVIPSTYQGNPVNYIGASAFRSCTELTSVKIPDSVFIIGNYAFNYCRSLTSVTIGNSVTRIGNSAFIQCHSLISVTIPDSVTYIGGGAFFHCSSLTNITFEGNAPDLFSQQTFPGVPETAKIIVNPGATGFGETVANLPVVIEANTSIYLDDKFSNGKSINKIDSCNVKLSTKFPGGEIFYTLDGTKPSFISTPYTAPFQLAESATIRVIAYSSDFTESAEAEPVSFRILTTYSLNVSGTGGGTVTIDPPDGPYVEGTEVTLTAKPEGDWQFITWEGATSSSDATITVTMNGAKALVPTFGTNVTVNEIGDGKVIQTPANPVPYGSTVTFDAVPDDENYFFRWAGEQKGNDNPTQLQITKPNPVISGLFAVATPAADPIQITIPNKTALPFTVSFTTAEGSTYVFQASGDLKNWSKVEEVNGTGGEVKVTDLREAIFQKQYYRVKLAE
ncbi:leucine-rich repeat protein [bacterium]|nr:leucine-rich repeat protein [bacterium]